jgi:dephospho-CoA kinase
MFKIGLTGGIGSGKTAATDYFQQLGIDVVDADVVAREVVVPGTPALAHIAEHFGAQILDTSGALDRAQLRQIIFSNPAEKAWLEALLHPLIRDEILRQLNRARSPYAILVSPLLFETEQHLLVDRSLLIDAPEALQLARASSRDHSSEQTIRSIMASQMPRAQKLAMADDVICNDRDLATLHAQVAALHTTYLKLAHDYPQSPHRQMPDL